MELLYSFLYYLAVFTLGYVTRVVIEIGARERRAGRIRPAGSTEEPAAEAPERVE